MSIIKYLLVVAFAQILKPYWMEISIIAAVIVAGIVIQHLLKLREEKKDRMEQNVDNGNRQYDNVVNHMYETAQESAEQAQKNIDDLMKEKQDSKPDTLGLMFRTLSNLGCQPTKNDDGTITVKYQGENFQMQFGGMYARVWDPMWSSVKADDPDLPNIREAVNDANYSFGPTIVMTKPDDEGIITFHSRCDIMLHPAVPDNEPYVAAILDSFFKIKEQMQADYQQIVTQQMETRKARRPVGYATNTDTNE